MGKDALQNNVACGLRSRHSHAVGIVPKDTRHISGQTLPADSVIRESVLDPEGSDADCGVNLIK